MASHDEGTQFSVGSTFDWLIRRSPGSPQSGRADGQDPGGHDDGNFVGMSTAYRVARPFLTWGETPTIAAGDVRP